MSCTSAIRYDVREDVLRTWLVGQFGDNVTETGLVVWNYTVVSEGHSSIWQVRAPRHITSDEQHQLKLDSLPRRTPTFGSRRGTG
ncbi:hypothetical protein FDECE_10085 [Fusarium decemcellulare]|nr:hypothetical protein FDECE_10085 [Fusarium decemcellulare]